MDNRFFSLIILPDSGGEVKSGSFNIKALAGLFGALIAVFFMCLFFIVGYHIKLSQEHNYTAAVSKNKDLTHNIESIREGISSIYQKIQVMQRNDQAFRHINRLDAIDDDMYQAGIGGHLIVDPVRFTELSRELRLPLMDITYDMVSLGSRVDVLNISFFEIQNRLVLLREEIDNTPTIMPTSYIRITSGYRTRKHPVTKKMHFHNGIDFGGRLGQDIFATADGVVKSAKREGYLGLCIKIQHKYGYSTVYGHLHKMLVAEGSVVKKGQIIGTMGRTGRATGIHVHYGVSLNRKSINPLTIINN